MTSTRWAIGLLAAGLCWAVPAFGQINNGDFDLDFEDPGVAWTKEGNVTIETVPGRKFALFREEGSGGLSRIWQVFDLPSPPDTPTSIEFKYGFFRDRSTRNSPVPPDSFTAFLIDENAQEPFLRTLGSEHPSFIRGFLYHDSDGRQLYDSDLVTVSPADNGMFSVQVDIEGISTTENIRLEFGFANGANGVNSYVILDDVASGCPQPDTIAPIVICPEDSEYDIDNPTPSSHPESTGVAEASDNCQLDTCDPTDPEEPTVCYSDEVHCGCPTVIFRLWSAVDEADNWTSCRQKITSVGETTDYYLCLESLFLDSCFFEFDPSLTLKTRVGGWCSVAELFTQCLWVKMHAPGHLSVCADRLEKALKDAGYFPDVPKGQLHKCVTNQLNDLYDALHSDTLQCQGGFLRDEIDDLDLPVTCP